MKKRIFTLFLAVALLFNAIAISSFAVEEGAEHQVTENGTSTELTEVEFYQPAVPCCTVPVFPSLYAV